MISMFTTIISVIISIIALIISWMTLHSQNKSSQELNMVLHTMSAQDERKRLYAFIHFVYEQCKSGDDILHSFRYKDYADVELRKFPDLDKRPWLAFICITYDFGFNGFIHWNNFEVAQFLNFYRQSKSDLELFRLYFPNCNDWYLLIKQYLDVLFSLYSMHAFMVDLGKFEEYNSKVQNSHTGIHIESTKKKMLALNIYEKWAVLWVLFDKCDTKDNLRMLESYVKVEDK